MTNTDVVFGITGMPGSGKSVVSDLFSSSFGAKIDSDKIGHEILKKNEVKKELVANFGEGIITEGQINRRVLSEIVFDSEKIKILNKISHPRIKTSILESIQENLAIGDFYIVEVPLLFESGFDSFCDYTFCIEASFQTRLNRVKSQRNWSENELRKRDSCQNESLKKNTSNILINGEGALEDLKKEINRFVIAFRYHSVLWLNEKNTVEQLIRFFNEFSWSSTLLKFNKYADR